MLNIKLLNNIPKDSSLTIESVNKLPRDMWKKVHKTSLFTTVMILGYLEYEGELISKEELFVLSKVLERAETTVKKHIKEINNTGYFDINSDNYIYK